MADINGLTVTALGAAAVTMPRFQIECVLTNPRTGAIVADFTGANAVLFPAVLGNLTAAQRREFLDMVLSWMLHTRGGVS